MLIMKTLLICFLLLSVTTVNAQQYAKSPNLKKASQLLKLGEFKRARLLLTPLAKKGHHKAQYLLATTYSGKDELKAFSWYMKSAKQGNPKSQLFIGKMYSFGIGVKQNTTKAIFWYKQSAKRGNKAAKQSLDYLIQLTQNIKKW